MGVDDEVSARFLAGAYPAWAWVGYWFGPHKAIQYRGVRNAVNEVVVFKVGLIWLVEYNGDTIPLEEWAP